MGYACEYVDSGQVNHLAEFTCAICCNLVDAPLLTTCHHVFCTACLQDWFDQSKKEARETIEILEGLNIPSKIHKEPLSVLSGGFKLRVLLAQVLASLPDVLLLDEPTNHLDVVLVGEPTN